MLEGLTATRIVSGVDDDAIKIRQYACCNDHGQNSTERYKGLFAKSNFKGMEVATCAGGCIGVLMDNGIGVYGQFSSNFV